MFCTLIRQFLSDRIRQDEWRNDEETNAEAATTSADANAAADAELNAPEEHSSWADEVENASKGEEDVDGTPKTPRSGKKTVKDEFKQLQSGGTSKGRKAEGSERNAIGYVKPKRQVTRS